jgi:hypothetical protein
LAEKHTRSADGDALFLAFLQASLNVLRFRPTFSANSFSVSAVRGSPFLNLGGHSASHGFGQWCRAWLLQEQAPGRLRRVEAYYYVFWTLEWQLRGNVIIRKAQRAIRAGDCRPRRRSSSRFPPLAPTRDSFESGASAVADDDDDDDNRWFLFVNGRWPNPSAQDKRGAVAYFPDYSNTIVLLCQC